MLLRLPPTLHYPITVRSLLKRPGDSVERGDHLFWYVYKTTVIEGDGLGNDIEVLKEFPVKFESSVDGTVVEWKISKGDIIDEPVNVVEIDEPCAHEVQFGGMCAECGKDMTAANYNTDVMDAMRAPIQMVHDNTALTVSQREATRVEEDAKRRLLASKRLSLVVDLDQTIIHATVDPTVGEWKEDKNNPNHEAVKDVRAFQLTDDGPGMRGCWYYIKLRPGLESFLQNISKLYELHIYTMGTRAYAQNIANIIDPDRKLFGDRILSRDESGSLTAKNLQRLFPVDTKMVVIIDDRGDVWKWNPNLIKVSPYDFFVGIGDINSSFLPKKQELTPGKTKSEKPAVTAPAEHHVNGTTQAKEIGNEVSALEQLVTMGGGDNPTMLLEQATQQEETIMHQVEDRPLLQKQKELDAEDDASESQAGAESETSTSSMDDSQDLGKHRHHLLEDHDRELFHLQDRLEKVHSEFFEEYERRRQRNLERGRVSTLRGDRTIRDRDIDLELLPDVKVIMPQIKQKVLGDVVLVFSGVLPLGTDLQNADISLWAKSFGATISPRIGSKTTHLVAGRNRTAKVREATRYPRIKIVTTQWLLDSLTQWKHMDEEPYLIPVHPEDRGEPVLGSSPGSKLEDSWLSSSDDDTGVSFTDDEDVNEEIIRSSGMTEHSPVGYTAAEQAAVHDELKEFLGSDDETDDEDDKDYVDDEEDDDEAEGNNNEEDPAATDTRKRKRDGDEETESEGTGTSRLAQRLKRSPGADDDEDMSKQGATIIPGTAKDEDDGSYNYSNETNDPTENADYDEDELEREMLAAFENGDYDENAEEAIGADNG
ncbi:RNA Polymerase II CTD phosphatase Fcp1, putative [Talaromyces stipitatus ATCC 10500]|uniref:RNA polymerase II subunit A C-terminal domain phosphatase n=1 Tax=Talaromyces stipitatus (strain ATCC 10500 / CBS 375.48 / QM 6759 / NRRL 1006) TaxID=441959 RepID=B8M4Z7_TALSN|nr:RNA Polymerase II CTD phosphatase Fcp1, putative [Talaromyces stipitatus ATCC 10500]EED19432.1 RNA Polymerase II CTD phosphatase Fcp1, putative [Talaromyces stipitatus ATCC 10500]